MHLHTVLHLLGRLAIVYGLILLVPLGIALGYADRHPGMGEPLAFGIAAGASMLIGFALRRFFKPDMERFHHREGFAIVAMGWTLFGVLGALPFALLGSAAHRLSLTDAFFESISGLTTTGSTVLLNIEAYGHGILFWRSLTQWLGGMGIIVLTVAILPGLGAGGYQMLKFEAPGPTADRIAPRIAQTAKILWFVYFIFTGAEFLLLWAPSWWGAGEMDWFDAVCHSFATLATGGFSTKNASLAHFSAYYQWVVIVFMYLAGVNFLLHFNTLRGKPRHMFKSSEWRMYTTVILVGTLIVFVCLSAMDYPEARVDESRVAATELVETDPTPSDQPRYADATTRARHSLFQVLAITTTTGFGTANFDAWPNVLRILLVFLMFFGACAGSTGGGMKQIRVMVLAKYAWRELRRLAQPRLVIHLKVGNTPVDRHAVSGILGTFLFFMFLTALGTVLISLDPNAGNTLETSFSAAVSTIANIGPGLGLANSSFAWMTDFSKWVSAALMIIGRLEVYAVLLLFVPATWRR